MAEQLKLPDEVSCLVVAAMSDAAYGGKLVQLMLNLNGKSIRLVIMDDSLATALPASELARKAAAIAPVDGKDNGFAYIQPNTAGHKLRVIVVPNEMTLMACQPQPKFPPYVDMHEIDEDTRIQTIGDIVIQQRKVIGCIIDDIPEKVQRYKEKLLAKFPGIVIEFEGHGPTPGAYTIRLGPPDVSKQN